MMENVRCPSVRVNKVFLRILFYLSYRYIFTGVQSGEEVACWCLDTIDHLRNTTDDCCLDNRWVSYL